MFFIFKRKRLALMLGLAIVLCALVINFGSNLSYDENDAMVVDSKPDQNPEMGDAVMVSAQASKIESIKNEREIVRSKVCELLSENIDNPNVSPQSKAEAEQKLLKIADNMDDELECESLLSLKGFENAVVFISDDVATVSVETDSITADDAAKINDVIFGQTGNNNIKIVEVK